VLARLVLRRYRWLFAGGDARDAEILALRHQVLVLQRQINRCDRTRPIGRRRLAPTTGRPSLDPTTDCSTGPPADRYRPSTP